MSGKIQNGEVRGRWAFNKEAFCSYALSYIVCWPIYILFGMGGVGVYDDERERERERQRERERERERVI